MTPARARWPPVAAAVAALVVGLGAAALLVSSQAPAAEVALTVAVCWSFVAAGLVARRRRPGNRSGTLLMAVGFAWAVTALASSPDPVLFTLGIALDGLAPALLAHLLVAFPSGRVEGRWPRVLVAAAYLDALCVQWLLSAFEVPECRCPVNLLLLRRDDGVAGLIADVQLAIAVVLVAGVLTLLVRRWRDALPHARRAAAPVLASGVAAVVLFAATLLVERFTDPRGAWAGALNWAFLLAFAAIPLGFLLGLLRARLAHTGVARLVHELADAPPPGRLRDALARGLGDPSLALAYWLPEQQRYVDLDGRQVDLPHGDARRSATVVEREGEKVAALVHDSALRDDPELLDAVRAAAGLALENERLHAELRTRLEELSASRARLVQAADEERRRIERNLHDGTQQRLVSVSMALGLAETRLDGDAGAARELLAEAREGLAVALEELRRLSQGIHPAVLTERGLAMALRELTLTAALRVQLDCTLDRRLPEAVEAAAYYLVAEALANIGKHAQATLARIQVRLLGDRLLVTVADDGCGGADPARGSGLRGLTDRVAVLGGHLVVESIPGQGTVLTAELPCA